MSRSDFLFCEKNIFDFYQQFFIIAALYIEVLLKKIKQKGR